MMFDEGTFAVITEIRRNNGQVEVETETYEVKDGMVMKNAV